MDRIKELLALLFGSCLLLEGKDHTFAKLPLWLAVLAALSSLRLLAITVVLAIAFGVKASTVKA